MQVSRLPGLRRAAQRTAGVGDRAVLFESWHGRLSDSPRAIAEELHRRGAGLDLLWVTRRGAAEPPEWMQPVEADSAAYLRALGSARWIVSNSTLPAYYCKRRAQTYLQTWHGTPLKRIGFDVPRPSPMATRRRLRHLAREAAAWDFLVAANAFSRDVFRRAFRYGGEIIESGYPRNDLLSSTESDEVRSATRRELGITGKSTAVLYAPTLRDGAAFSLELDLELMRRRLGESHVFLLRAHERVAADIDADEHPNLIDVSAVDDIRELYLAADVLLTDYSSAMFDFAVTGKPILFFTYDLADYRDRLRGFYFDFESEAPGPLLETNDELAEALAGLAGVSAQSASSYTRFRDRFCSLEDGGASSRVVERVFS